MPRTLQPPRLHVEFDGSDSAKFVIEELTFNPYIRQSRLGLRPQVDLWVEFAIRCCVDDNREHEVPAVLLRFLDDNGLPLVPTATIAATRSGEPIDLNELMYAEIWYSCVILDRESREFMSSGYKKAIRVIDETCTKAPSLFMSGPDVTLLHEQIEDNNIGRLASNILARATEFADYLKDFPLEGSDWLKEPLQVSSNELVTVYRTAGAQSIAWVPFERARRTLRGRFACRREPWIWNSDQPAPYGYGYGGT
jgi:hypothetical protein